MLDAGAFLTWLSVTVGDRVGQGLAPPAQPGPAATLVARPGRWLAG